MKQFLRPTKAIIIIYSLFLLNNIHLLVGEMINKCDQSMSFCVKSISEIIWLISFFILLPIKLLTSPLDYLCLVLNPFLSFVILLFIYYLYASLIYYLFKNKRKIFYAFIIIIPILVIASFVLIIFSKNQKNYYEFSNNTSSSRLEGQVNENQNIINNGYLKYESSETGIAFNYPNNLTIFTTDEEGDPILPDLFFDNLEYPKNYNGNYCSQDCINITSFTKAKGSAYYDIPGKDIEEEEFPIYDYPKYVHKDETESKYFDINGLKAKKYYVAGLNSGVKNAQKLYVLEERVYIEDPYLSERIIEITYHEISPNPYTTSSEPINFAKNMTPAEIKELFNKKQHDIFEKIVSSITIPKYDLTSFSDFNSKTLGLKFSYPSYWGKIIENKKNFFASDLESIFISFKSPLISYGHKNLVKVIFEVDNPETASYAYEGPPPLFQYGGQSLNNACQNNAYLNSSNFYDVKIEECSLKKSDNGVPLVVFEGGFTAMRYAGYGKDEIPVEQRKFKSLKGAIFQTKSSQWPGMGIYLEDAKKDENIFDKIINSLSYTKEIIFDNCHPINEYENMAWYSQLKNNFNNDNFNKINEACYSKNSDLVIAIISGEYCELGEVYKYDIKNDILKKAGIENNRGCLASVDEFGQREGEIIKLEGKSGDAGCSSTMYYDYKLMDNIIELKKEYNKCEGDEGVWKNY